MRPVHDQPLQQHARDLLLHHLAAGLEQEQQHTREVVRVVVRVPQLVRDGVQEHVATLGVQILRQLLEQVSGATVDGRRRLRLVTTNSNNSSRKNRKMINGPR